MKKYALLFVTLAGQALYDPVKAADNVHFSGSLVATSCTIPDSEKDIHLDFGALIAKNFYQSERTESEPFTIHLEKCNSAIASTVGITFQGAADTELTNMLALDASSTAKGVAIGLEMTDGTALPINKSAPFVQLTDGNNNFTFNAFVQAQPTAALNKSLTIGDFTATSTFVLAYQ